MEWFAELDQVNDLEELKQYCLQCRDCDLGKNGSHVVFGEGNPAAKLMLVGEAPGAEEDRLRRPFVGAAGQLLDKILKAAGIMREEVYITNVVKCRPPQNRFPKKEESDRCFVYQFDLTSQINKTPIRFFFLGKTVLRRAAFDNIGNIDLLPHNPGCF